MAKALATRVSPKALSWRLSAAGVHWSHGLSTSSKKHAFSISRSSLLFPLCLPSQWRNPLGTWPRTQIRRPAVSRLLDTRAGSLSLLRRACPRVAPCLLSCQRRLLLRAHPFLLRAAALYHARLNSLSHRVRFTLSTARSISSAQLSYADSTRCSATFTFFTSSPPKGKLSSGNGCCVKPILS